jgi:hypothetical protein
LQPKSATAAAETASYEVKSEEEPCMDMTVILLIPIAGTLGLFTLLSVAAWADQRRKEREALYRSETLKKLAESTGEVAQQILAMIREQDREETRKGLEGMKIGGLVVTVVGAGVMIMLRLMTGGQEWTAGLIPLLVGLALLLYVYVLAPRNPQP